MRTKAARPIRRIICGLSLPLPSSWTNFISLPENNFNLLNFLSMELIEKSQYSLTQGRVLIVGGFGSGSARHSAGCDISELSLNKKKQTPACCYTVNMDQEKATSG